MTWKELKDKISLMTEENKSVHITMTWLVSLKGIKI